MQHLKHPARGLSGVIILLALAFSGCATRASARGQTEPAAAVTSVTVDGQDLVVSLGADRLVVRACSSGALMFDYRPSGEKSPETLAIDESGWT